jgi:succinoglycan biosynthesis protein ExoV
MTERDLVVLRYVDDTGNFGDDVNDLLWPALLPEIRLRTVSNRSTGSITGDDQILIGVGTILNERIPAVGRKLVLGSGTGYLDLPSLDETYEVLAVRGPLTADALGLERSLAATDSAALLQDVDIDDQHLPAMDVAFVPHHRSMACLPWDDVCERAGMRLVDPRQPPSDVINQLRSASLVLAEAMHGAIVADLYGIPWIPLRMSYLILDFKWRDWCASLDLDYRPERGPTLRWPNSWKGRTANLAARTRVARFLRAASRRAPMLSDRAALSEKTDRLRTALDHLRLQVGRNGG